jgi:hypothetical protein
MNQWKFTSRHERNSSFRVLNARLRIRCILVILSISGAVLSDRPANADVLYGTATMGDSLSIKADPFKWPVLLQTYRDFNFGGDNLPFVHAVGGATSADVLTLREPQKVASPVLAGKVTSATFLVGGDDYADAGPSFINGSLSGAALTTFENQIVSNIEEATGIVLDSGIQAFILGSVPFVLGEPQAAPLIARNCCPMLNLSIFRLSIFIRSGSCLPASITSPWAGFKSA